jgi:hypothetical protein
MILTDASFAIDQWIRCIFSDYSLSSSRILMLLIFFRIAYGICVIWIVSGENYK